MTGTAVISNMSPAIGDTLTASINGGSNTGILTYTWKADGEEVQSDASVTYAVSAGDYGKVITLEITSDTEAGMLEAGPTASVKNDRRALTTLIPSAAHRQPSSNRAANAMA